MKLIFAILIVACSAYGLHAHAQNKKNDPRRTQWVQQTVTQAADPSPTTEPAEVTPAATPQPATALPLPSASPMTGANSRPTRRGVVMKFQPSVRNVGDALRYIATPIGYRIIIVRARYQDTLAVFNRELPPDASSGALLSIEDAMTTLIGDDALVRVDHSTKFITVEKL